jgi:II/X family phage/plasmid replication protein
MIDTVKLVSPELSESDIERIELACTRRSAVHLGTGDVQYEFTTGSLEGSYDHRLSVKIERERWDSTRLPGGRVHTRLVPCLPRLSLEGSVHKAMLGHNVSGGPLEPVLASRWLCHEVSERLGVSLPPGDFWEVLRIDWAEAYDLGSFEACQEYIEGLNAAQFPRRKVVRFGSESLMAGGSTTSVKVYHKGPEFSAHDWKRFKKAGLPESELIGLQAEANCILRLETSIKSRKLSELYNGKPQVVQVRQNALERLHDREVARLLKEAKHDMETVRTHHEVRRRLIQFYPDSEGRFISSPLNSALFHTWTQLALVGEKEVRRFMSRRTFYRHKKMLAEAGVSWEAADVRIIPRHSAIPTGFSPTRNDPRRLVALAEPVREKLALAEQLVSA